MRQPIRPPMQYRKRRARSARVREPGRPRSHRDRDRSDRVERQRHCDRPGPGAARRCAGRRSPRRSRAGAERVEARAKPVQAGTGVTSGAATRRHPDPLRPVRGRACGAEGAAPAPRTLGAHRPLRAERRGWREPAAVVGPSAPPAATARPLPAARQRPRQRRPAVRAGASAVPNRAVARRRDRTRLGNPGGTRAPDAVQSVAEALARHGAHHGTDHNHEGRGEQPRLDGEGDPDQAVSVR